MSNPSRVVIDIKNTHLKNSSVVSNLSSNGVRSFSIAQRKNSTVRIVIETEKPYKSRVYQPMASRSIIIISLPKSGAITPPQNNQIVKEGDISISSILNKKNKNKNKNKKVEPKQEQEATIMESIFGKSKNRSYDGSGNPRKKGYTIVVDAGHGGHDSGAIGSKKYYEKTLVLQIAKRVYRHLRKRGYNVKMTRTNDKFIKLKNRTRFANRNKADIFVSIHANAVGNRRRAKKVHGVETYFLQTTRSAKSQRIAAIENSVVLDKNDYLSNNVILEAVLSGPKIELSHKLAIDVQSKILKNLRHKYRGVKDGGVKPAPFWVLVGAQMPSILVEVGYITNPYERARLFSPAYQNRIAIGIAEGIANYLAIREREFY